MAKNKLPILVTPKGYAAYAWLQKKDTKFGGEGTYKVSLVLDKKDIPPGRVNYGNEQLPGRDWVKHVLALCAEGGVPSKVGAEGCPVKDGDQMKEDFHGKLVMTFKTGFDPQLVDTKGAPLPRSVPIYSGDLIKVAFQPKYTEVGGKKFLSMFISKVMLVEKLVEAGGVSMGDEDGYSVEDDASAVPDVTMEDDDVEAAPERVGESENPDF